jgi:hypothetical protein
MRWTKCAVCVLALAGGAVSFFVFPKMPAGSLPPHRLRASKSPIGRAPASLSIPVTFEPNVGQGAQGVQFIGRGKGMAVLLDGDGLLFALPRREPGAATDDGEFRMRLVQASSGGHRHWKKISPNGTVSRNKGRTRGTHSSGWHKRSRPEHWRNLRDGSSRAANSGAGNFHTRKRGKPVAWRGMKELRAKANYFLGNDRSKWRTNVAVYAMVSAKDIAPGVDAIVYGNGQENGQGLEYDLRLRSGNDASKLRLRFSPNARLRLANDGDLIISSGEDKLRMRKPRIYEERADASPAIHGDAHEAGDAEEVAIDGEYVLQADGSAGFAIGPHDPRRTLVIDPSLSVTYSTFLGGAGNETVSSMGLDSSGNVYVGGVTTNRLSFTEPLTATLGPGIGSSPSNSTATEYFIAKINPNLSGSSSLVYLTFIGGSVSQTGGLIAVGSSGEVVLTGTTTSPDFPVTDGRTRTSGANDVTVSEIDSSGSAIVFSTLFGGSGSESQFAAGGIALDSAGNIYVASDTSSTDLPVTKGVFQPTLARGNNDGFVAEFQPAEAPSLVYCSYLGANTSAEVGVGGMAIDAAKNVYVAGFTSNTVSTLPKNAFQTVYGGGDSDAFLMKILPTGQGAADLIYATLLGGNGIDQATAVAVDDSIPANAYITGTTQSTNFPTNGAVAAYQPSMHPNAMANAFLSVVAQNLNTGGATLAYSTYLGGSDNDSGLGIAVTAFNSVYLMGTTRSPDFPWHDNLQPFNGTSDAFVAKFDPSLPGAASLAYSTPLGGTAPPGLAAITAGNAIMADDLGDIYIAGQTTAADFPTAVTTSGVMNGFQPICASCQNFPAAADAFVVALRESTSQQPSVYFSSGSVVFPAAPIGTQNTPQPVAVHNGGEAPLVISSLQITGPNAQDFSLIGPGACSGVTVSTATECSFEVGFVPSTTGPEGAVVSISDNASGNPQVLELIGAGQGPLVSLSTTTLNFGSQPENTNSLSQTITVANVGNQALTLQSPVESGPDVAQFFFSGKDITCGSSVAAGTSCAIGVVFAPKAIGTFHAQITLTDNSGGIANSTQIIAVAGTATAPAPVATVTPSGLAFGGIRVGTASGTQQVTVLNTGSTVLSVTSIATSGANTADFAVASFGSGACTLGRSTLAAQASCTVSVRFAPAATDSPGAKSAGLVITDNAAGSPQVVALSGTATASPTIQVSTPSLQFEPQSAGTASTTQIVTVTNPGTTSLSINGFSVGGANAADFRQANNCPPSLGAGAFCTVSVVFQPTFEASPTRSAILNISDNASGSPQLVALSGSATQAAIQISPTSINFGGQQAGTASSPQTITVTNTGTGNLSFSSVVVTGGSDFIVGANRCSASQTPPGQTCTIQLTFSPVCANGVATRNGNLMLTDNVPGNPQTVPLSGTATGDFCFMAASAVTIAPGQTANYTVVVNSPSGYKGTVSLTCANVPSASTCSIPASVNVPSQFAVSVPTTAGSSTVASGGAPGMFSLTSKALAFALLLLIWIFAWCLARAAGRPEAPRSLAGSRLSHRVTFLWVGALCASVWIAACSSGGGGDPAPASTPGTPAGAYSLMVTGTSPNTTAHVTLALTVQ